MEGRQNVTQGAYLSLGLKVAKSIKWSHCVFDISLDCAESVSRPAGQAGGAGVWKWEVTHPCYAKCPQAQGLRGRLDHSFISHAQ